MPDLSNTIIFIGAALVLLLTPGPAVIYIVARSLEQGRIAGVVSALGVSVGTLFHIAAAVLGLSALIASSIMVFNILKYVGAIYLIYLGVKALFFYEESLQTEIKAGKELKNIFFQAVVVNIFNPKTTLFFIAFFPQFIDVSRGAVSQQILFYGIVLLLLGACTDSLYALLAGSVKRLLKGDLAGIPRFVSGSVYVILGLVTAFSSLDN